MIYNSIIDFKEKSTTCYQHVTNRKQQTIEIKCFVLHIKIKHLNKALIKLSESDQTCRPNKLEQTCFLC